MFLQDVNSFRFFFLFFTVFERDVLSHFQFLLTKMIKQYNATDEIYFCEQLMGHFLRVK